MLKMAVLLLLAKYATGIANCTTRLDRWLTNTIIPDMEYYVSKGMMSFPECTAYCNQLDSCAHIAENLGISLTTSEFTDAMCLSLSEVWVQKIREESLCYILSNRSVTQTLPCESTIKCLCQRHADTSTKTYGDTFIKGYKFCLDFSHRVSHDSTLACKHKWNSTVVSYSDPMKYLQLTKSLNLKKSQYWLKNESLGQGDKCLALTVTDDNSFLQETDCNKRFYSICCKLTNLTVDLSNQYSINVKKTNKAVSKLTSAIDSRTLAKVLGGIGALVIVNFVALIVAMDLGNLVQTCKGKQFCKKNTATRVQPI